MGLTSFTVSNDNLATGKHCRLDQKYYYFTNIHNWIVFESKFTQVRLYDFLEELPIIKFKKGNLDDEYYLVNISDQEQRNGELVNIQITNEIGSDKNYLGEADIFISKLGMTRGYIFLNSYKEQNVLGSTEFIPYKIKNPEIKLLLKYILLHPKALEAYSYLESGKTPSHRRVNPYEFLKIKIPLIPKTTQDIIISQIIPIEKIITKLKSQTKDQKGIINNVFAKTFGFDFVNADNKKKRMAHFSSLVEVANEELKFDISLKYRYIFNRHIKNQSKIEWVQLGKVVDIKGGKRLQKGQNVTEEDTGFKYVRVDDLNWSGFFDIDNIKYISKKNHNKIQNYIAKKDDILLTIVGATVGKCGLVPAELDGENITENFARLIIKDKGRYLPEYINYCLQSKISIYQIDEFKGRSSQGKLALFRIKKIKVPNLTRNDQQKIVDEIKAELDCQEQIKADINIERNKIDEIIENTIKNSEQGAAH